MTEPKVTSSDSGARREVEIPYGVRAGAAWTWRLAVIAAGVFAVLYVVAFFQLIVVPVLVAVLVSALLAPLVNRMVLVGLPRGAAVAVALLVTFLVVIGLLVLVGTQVATGFSALADRAGAGFRQVQDWLTDGPLNLSNAQIDEYVAQAREQLSGSSEQLVSGALSFTSTAGHVVTGAFLAVFASIFFLLDGRRIWGWVIGLLPTGVREPMDGAGRRGWVTLTSYVRATIAVAVVDALGIGVGAAILGVPLAVPLGVLVFLASFVPIIGAVVSGGVAVLVALVSEGPVVALIMLAIVLAVQQLESHVLQPFLLGRAVKVHPLAVVLAIAAGVLVAGVVGALFAVPLVAVANTMVGHLATTPVTRSPVASSPVASSPVDADAAPGAAG